ncbi:MAG: leucine-rich repeat protein [Acutalibacteraceae bacterium]|nr:leucine-rich repeat protein [Acutalibacteraceae bacterium]
MTNETEQNREKETFEELKRRYGKYNFWGSLTELKEETKDIDWDAIVEYNERVMPFTSLEYFLVCYGILGIKDDDAEEKLAEVVKELKKLYPEDKKFPGRYWDLAVSVKDLPVSKIDGWTKQLYQKRAWDYLTEVGIFAKTKTTKEKLDEITEKLKARYVDGQLVATSYSNVKKQNPDLEVGSLLNWVQKVCGQKVNDYLKEQGIITDLKKEPKKDNAPQSYYVPELDLCGEEADDWEITEYGAMNPGEFFIKDYLGNKESVTVPVSLNGKAVTGLANYCMKECKAKHIEFPGYYKEIPMDTCSGNKSIFSVVFGDGVEKIGSSVFHNATNLHEIKASASINTCDSSAFSDTIWYDHQGAYVVVGSVLTCFNGKGKVINVPHGVKTVNSYVASYCNAKKVVLPDTVTTLCAKAFYGHGNDNIQEFIFSDSLVDIGYKAICKNKWTESFKGEPIIINGQLYLYENASGTVIIPEGVTKICDEVFCKNDKIEKVVFPSTLKAIGYAAFSGCHNLTEIEFADGIEQLGSSCFSGCKNLKTVLLPDSLLKIGNSAFSSCNELTEIILGADIEIIGEEAFENCKKLALVKMNKKLKTIEKEAFEDCSSLKEILLPETVTEIGKYAFYRCRSLKKINIPEGVTIIQEGAFKECYSLLNIELHNGITEIEYDAFSRCEMLERIKLPAKIGAGAFRDCYGIKEIIFNENTVFISSSAFSDCTGLANIVFPKKLETIKSYAFYNCTNLVSIHLPDTIKTIEYRAFGNCSSLSEVDMSCTVDNIDTDAFENTEYIKKAHGDFVIVDGVLSKYLGEADKVIIPDEVTTIGKSVFEKQSDLKEVVFGKNIRKICENAFSGAFEISKIDLSNTSLVEIEKGAFTGTIFQHNSIKKLLLPDTIEIIGRHAFCGINIDKIKLPVSVLKVERSAFYGAKELVVYDTIDPEAEEAASWQYDEFHGKINSSLSAALLCLDYYNCFDSQRDTKWNAHHITVLSSETDKIRYRIFCASDEGVDYKALMFSAWGKHASFKFEEYDSYFAKIKNADTRAETAFCRLMYPEGLTEEHRKVYESYFERCLYIKQSAKRIAEIIADKDAVDRLEFLDKYKTVDARNIAWLREIFENNKSKKCLKYLAKHHSV